MKTKGNAGAALAVGLFGLQTGKALPGIIDPLGRVFEPSPYNMPQHYWKVTRFSLKMVLAMIDSGQFDDRKWFNEDQITDFREQVQDFLNFVNMQDSILDQPPPHAEQGEWVLYSIDSVRTHGVRFNLKDIFIPCPSALTGTIFNTKKPPVPPGQKLVAVVKVRPNKDTSWTVAFDATSNFGYYQLSTIHPCSWWIIEMFLVEEKSLEPLQGPPPPFC